MSQDPSLQLLHVRSFRLSPSREDLEAQLALLEKRLAGAVLA